MKKQVEKYRWQVALFLTGVVLAGAGVILTKYSVFDKTEIEVISESEANQVVVEVSGSVEMPGVYHLAAGSRMEDALISAGGLAENADRNWVEKALNRAAKVVDGMKIYIPSVDEHSNVLSANNVVGESGGDEALYSFSEERINVNTASQKTLESLWGIGPVTAKNIIEQRPYSNVEELLVKKILKKNVYERNKDKLTVY